MKKVLLLAVAAIMAAGALQAKTVDEFRIYLNAGHGGYGPNDRPLPTIAHPNQTSLTPANTNPEDTMGFFEGRGTLPRTFGIGDYLKSIGVKTENIVYSRVANGPFPYDHNAEDSVRYQYNRELSVIDEEVEAGGFDMFISSHSNAATDGTSTNYPLFLYRGYDTGSTGPAGYNGPGVEGSDEMGKFIWPYHYMDIEPQSYYSKTNPNVRGDINFYGSYSTATRSNGKQYSGYLGVLKHGVPGYLLEGFFHTYQPARHRALNFDYDRLEGIREARGVAAYFGFAQSGKGEIVGTVKDLHEKISHNLYKYAYGSDDQWLPLNGAKVVLKKGGTEVATYTTDNEWNGFFAFFDLEPGDYTVEATIDGYKALEAPVNAKVTANETCYSYIKLENEDYVPTEIVYENYPDPVQPGYLKIASEYVFTQDEGTAYDGIEGDIAQTLQYGDSTIVLSHVGKTAKLYIIDDNTKQIVKQLSTTGLFTMEDNPGFYNEIGSIALSADKKLVGVTAVRNSYADSNVPSGYKRGTMHAYYWDNFDADPTELFSSQYTSNWYNADMGLGIAVSGKLSDCVICVPAPTSGSSRGIRPAFFAIGDGALVSTSRANAQGTLTMVGLGDPLATEGNIDNYPTDNLGKIKVAVSPFDDKSFIIGGSKGKIYEFALTSDGGIPASYNVFPEGEEVLANGMQFFKYAGHVLMVAPYGTTGNIKGIKLFDVTEGLANPVLLKTTNTDVAAPAGVKGKKAATLSSAAFAWANAVVEEEDITTYLAGTDKSVVKISTKDADQPVVKGIYAYGLTMTETENGYTFVFNSNDDAENASLILTNPESGEEVESYVIPNVTVGQNEFSLTNDQIPGENGDQWNWAVNVQGKPIARISLLNTPDDWHSTTSLFSAVDNNPESDYFGRIYVNERAGQPNDNNGVWIYDQMWNKVNSTVLRGGLDLRSPYRVAVAPDGYVFIADWSDPGSGVYVMDPANPEGAFTQFFDGARNGDGLFTNVAGEPIGSSSTGIGFVGKGANTKMYAHLEDQSESIFVYNVGQPDGTIAHTWNAAPVATGLSMTNGNVSITEDPTTGGVWISQVRGAGNNDAATPSFKYLTPDNKVKFNSGSDLPDLNGSLGAGLAVSNDGKELVINNGTGDLEFFNVAWNEDGEPVLTPKGYTYTASVRRTNGTGHNNYIYQIHYDPAGNLICSGDQMGVYSMPTDDNQTTTPAKKRLLVTKKSVQTAVTDVDAQKTVANVRYVNVAGMVSDKPFEGVNIIVTTYTDGTSKTTKVVK